MGSPDAETAVRSRETGAFPGPFGLRGPGTGRPVPAAGAPLLAAERDAPGPVGCREPAAPPDTMDYRASHGSVSSETEWTLEREHDFLDSGSVGSVELNLIYAAISGQHPQHGTDQATDLTEPHSDPHSGDQSDCGSSELYADSDAISDGTESVAGYQRSEHTQSPPRLGRPRPRLKTTMSEYDRTLTTIPESDTDGSYNESVISMETGDALVSKATRSCCFFCLDPYALQGPGRPQLLPCQHKLCFRCVEQIQTPDVVQCPFCHQTHRLARRKLDTGNGAAETGSGQNPDQSVADLEFMPGSWSTLTSTLTSTSATSTWNPESLGSSCARSFVWQPGVPSQDSDLFHTASSAAPPVHASGFALARCSVLPTSRGHGSRPSLLPRPRGASLGAPRSLFLDPCAFLDCCTLCLHSHRPEGPEAPKTLPCRHRVCLGCLEQLVTTSYWLNAETQEWVEDSVITCPFCAEMCAVPVEGPVAFPTEHEPLQATAAGGATVPEGQLNYVNRDVIIQMAGIMNARADADENANYLKVMENVNTETGSHQASTGSGYRVTQSDLLGTRSTFHETGSEFCGTGSSLRPTGNDLAETGSVDVMIKPSASCCARLALLPLVGGVLLVAAAVVAFPALVVVFALSLVYASFVMLLDTIFACCTDLNSHRTVCTTICWVSE